MSKIREQSQFYQNRIINCVKQRKKRKNQTQWLYSQINVGVLFDHVAVIFSEDEDDEAAALRQFILFK